MRSGRPGRSCRLLRRPQEPQTRGFKAQKSAFSQLWRWRVWDRGVSRTEFFWGSPPRRRRDPSPSVSTLPLCLPACLPPAAAAAAAKSLPSCPTLCDPLDGSPPGSPSLGCSRQEHWRGLPFPSPGGLTHCWQRDPALQSRWGAHRGGGREGAECSEEKQFGRMGCSEEETETAVPRRPVTAHRSLGCSETSRYPGYASEPLNQNVWGSDLSTSDLQIFPADSHCVVQDEILKSWSHVLDSSSMQDKLSILTYSR